MNYLTAVLAVPTFLLIWLFECFLFKNRFRARESTQIYLQIFMVVSTLQFVSCIFWLIGFALGYYDDGSPLSIFSEANKPDENGNCFGLVGAEVLLSIFQALTTTTVVMQYFILTNATSAVSIRSAFKLSSRQRICLAVLVTLLVIYTIMAWFTAHNRRCPKSEAKYFLPFQHHFYPVYLVIDSVVSVATFIHVKQTHKEQSTALNAMKKSGSTRELNTEQPAGGAKSDYLSRLIVFFKLQMKITLVGCFLAIGIFILQFSLAIQELSMISCVFCLMMYITYALRRVVLVAQYTTFQWSTRGFKKTVTRTGHSGGPSTTAPSVATTVASNQAKATNSAAVVPH